jgi:RNA polymerase sigma factor (sigma-70 family)
MTLRTPPSYSKRDSRLVAPANVWKLLGGPVRRAIPTRTEASLTHLPREERELWYRLTHHQDPRSREALIRRYARLPRYCYQRLPLTQRFPPDPERKADLLQEGHLALVQAVDDFNPAHPKQAQFLTFATWRVLGQMRHMARLYERWCLRESSCPTPRLYEQPESLQGLDQNLILAELIRKMEPLLSRVERRIFLEVCLGGDSLKELSVRTGIPYRRVRSLAVRTRATLARTMQQLGME